MSGRGRLWGNIHRLKLPEYCGHTSGRPDGVVFHVMREALRRPQLSGVEVERLPSPEGLGCRFPLEMLVVRVEGGALEVAIRYARDRFDPGVIADIGERDIQVLCSIGQDARL